MPDVRYPAGSHRELFALALPLILSNSFTTVQIFLDRILLSWDSASAIAASVPAAMLFWTPLTLFQQTAAYATTFVAQYTGANRPERVGPAVWQALYFSIGAGILFLAFIPLAGPAAALGNHSPAVQALEVVYFQCLCYAALPNIVVAAATAFFAGRGDSWTVLWVNVIGMVLNVALAIPLIFGLWGFPRMGIAGAGWATVVASYVAAAVAVALLFRREYRVTYNTLRGCGFEPALFGRLMYFGLPNGVQWAVEGLAFLVFLFIVGGLGVVAQTATSIAISINLLAILPVIGVGQAVEILVGQRLGQNRADLAEQSTWAGVRIGLGYMCSIAALYAFTPWLFVGLFANANEPEWPAIALTTAYLLRYVALYSIFDALTAVVSFALRGAGDTRFVTLVAIGLAWPVMVLPTWLSFRNGASVYWPWAFATLYVIAMAIVFGLRFRAGKWRTMRVIESVPDAAEAIVFVESLTASRP